MDTAAPAALTIDRQALTMLNAVLLAAAPEEGCALLLGERGPWRLRRVWPCLNVWEPRSERHHRFALDPREQLLAQKWARAQGLTVLGSAHSHPRSAPVPSDLDRALAFPPALLLILGTTESAGAAGEGAAGAEGPATAGEARTLACWWLPEQGPPRQVVWRMVDQCAMGPRRHAPS